MSLQTILNRIETLGNRLPEPAFLFIYLAIATLLVSAISALAGISALHPISGEQIYATNLLSTEGLHKILQNTVKNFTGFAPVGTVLVAVLGIGIAEHSGLIGVVLKSTIQKAPAKTLSFFVVLAGVLSSLAADTGYVVLIPLAALIFHSAGRSPLVGIAAAFAGVSGGYSANLMIGPLDAILSGISTEAAQLVVADYTVGPEGNYYFIFASTFMIGIVGTWVTEKLISPRMEKGNSYVAAKAITPSPLSDKERSALLGVAAFTAIFVVLILLGTIPENGALRHPETNSVLRSPFISGIVTIIAFYAAISGIIFGKLSGTYNSETHFIQGMEVHMKTMAGYLVLMFFAAQFVAYFSWSNLGSILAINGAQALETLGLHSSILLVSFILMAAFINLFIGSASAKWALLAPIFVPMFLLAGLSPESTQVAYRIGDSCTNILTPLMPYFGVIVAYAQRYDKKTGVGTIMALMLPYSLAFLICWSLLLVSWILLDIPLGPGAAILVR